MNIFYIDTDPIKAAVMLCDKHIVSQCVEMAQILCSVSWRYKKSAPYKVANEYHPSVLWAGNSRPNWDWVTRHALALCKEYTKRYRKTHKSEEVINWCENYGGKPMCGIAGKPALVMPEEYRGRDPVESYRRFYVGEKSYFAEWKDAKEPCWFTNGMENWK